MSETPTKPKRRWGRIILWSATILVLGLTGLALVVFKTDLLLADLRPARLGTEAEANRTLDKLGVYHGSHAAWSRLGRVRLTLRGSVRFLPARLALGLRWNAPDVALTITFRPARYGLYQVRLENAGERFEGSVDTRRNRTRRGLLFDSVRHLFELPLSAQVIPLRRGMESARWNGEQLERVFATWGRFEPQSKVDQLILWVQPNLDGRGGHLKRVDTTGRDIAPFTKARIELLGTTRLGAFLLPAHVRVFALDSDTRLIDEWWLERAEILP